MSAGPARLFVPHGRFRPRVLRALVRYRWFIRLRWAFVAGALLLLVLERWSRPEVVRPLALWGCIAALAGVNVGWLLLRRPLLGMLEPAADDSLRYAIRTAWFANLQMCVDLVLLTVTLRFAGGVESPLVIFYLFHTVLAALLLRPANAVVQATLALLLFSGLAVGECSGGLRPHHPFLPYAAGTVEHANPAFVAASLGVLVAGVFGTLFFTLQVSARLDEQEGELHRTIYDLRRSREDIRRLQYHRSRFMQTAAHQLKSPLAGARTLVSLIHNGVAPAEQVPALCGRIMRRCDEGIQQVGELLALARIQQRDATARPLATVHVGSAVRRVCAQHEPAAREKGLAFGCRIAPGQRLGVRIDAADLCDAVANLVDNAIKYTPAGAVEVEVRREGGRTGRGAASIVIAVRDSGIGLDREVCARLRHRSGDLPVFDAYRRGDNALAAGIPGTGLGLTIVREVAERYGGSVRAAPVRPAGSLFELRLPAVAGAGSGIEAGPGEAVAGPGSVAGVSSQTP